MGKVKSFIQFNGTIEGLNFYVVNGQQYVRKAGGGFNGKKIKSDPSMVKVRQNGEEFGKVSTLSRAFRLKVEPLFPVSYSGGLHNRLVKLFSGIKNLDVTSERGKRSVSVGLEQEASHALLIGFFCLKRKTQETTSDRMTKKAKLPDNLKHSECERGDLAKQGGGIPPICFVRPKANLDN